MPDPATREEYDRLFAANSKIHGHGTDTGMTVPCPFCAAPDCATYKILEVEAVMTKGATCKACGRGWRAEVEHPPGGGTVLEFVQTGGADPAPYLPPMRRVPAASSSR